MTTDDADDGLLPQQDTYPLSQQLSVDQLPAEHHHPQVLSSRDAVTDSKRQTSKGKLGRPHGQTYSFGFVSSNA